MTRLHFESDPAPACWIASTGSAIVAFTTRHGGVSAAPFDSLNLSRSTADDPAAVNENRHRVLSRLGCSPERLATAGQVHGGQVARVVAPGLHRECDALVTAYPDLPLAITAADCVPVVLAAGERVGTAHAGWRGLEAGILAATVGALTDAASLPARAHAWIGPCIRACCYEVGAEVAERFSESVRTIRQGSTYLDLPAAARQQLIAAGIPEDRIADVGECTRCTPGRYFSHRGDGARTGRQWAVVVRRA